jgi:hypothetical protein
MNISRFADPAQQSARNTLQSYEDFQTGKKESRDFWLNLLLTLMFGATVHGSIERVRELPDYLHVIAIPFLVILGSLTLFGCLLLWANFFQRGLPRRMYWAECDYRHQVRKLAIIEVPSELLARWDEAVAEVPGFAEWDAYEDSRFYVLNRLLADPARLLREELAEEIQDFLEEQAAGQAHMNEMVQ